MSTGADPRPDTARRAAVAADLARVQGKVESARAVLARLLQDVVVAESRLGDSEAARLLAANEQLVVTALRHQADAERAAKALAKVSRSAEVDPLTQLPNRVLLLDRFAQALALARRNDGRLALLFVDLNNFKHINDTLGHATGDEVLKVVAHRLVAAVRDADTVSRHGGDEFVILLTDIGQPADAGRIAHKLAAALGAPSRVGDQVLRLTASIGISVYPDDGDDVQTLVSRADAAMYRAKRQGLGSHAFHGAAEVVSQRGAVPLPEPVARYDAAVEAQRRHDAELREANEQLVLAVLDARELQAGAERARQRQLEFLDLIARELDNPLAPIRLAAAMLGKVQAAEPLLPKARAIIDAQARKIELIVAAVREVKQAGAFALTLGHRSVDLGAVVDAAVTLCRPAMDARLQTFTSQLPGVAVHVFGDADRLQQVVTNLLDNASHFTSEGGQIELLLWIGHEMAELTVSDDGIGISAATLPQLFEPFSQDVPAIGLHGGPGVGIGLTVVRTLVEAHGGTVSAHSAGAGCGSQFTVRLPLAQAPDAATAATAA